MRTVDGEGILPTRSGKAESDCAVVGTTQIGADRFVAFYPDRHILGAHPNRVEYDEHLHGSASSRPRNDRSSWFWRPPQARDLRKLWTRDECARPTLKSSGRKSCPDKAGAVTTIPRCARVDHGDHRETA